MASSQLATLRPKVDNVTMHVGLNAPLRKLSDVCSVQLAASKGGLIRESERALVILMQIDISIQRQRNMMLFEIK